MPMTYDVRVWKTEKYIGARVTTYRVRWIVAGRRWKRPFRNRAQADSFRAELVGAARRGEAFDTETGEPVRMGLPAKDAPWFRFACEYADMKWKPAAAKYRRSIAEALTTTTLALLLRRPSRPPDKDLRLAMLGWGFNTARRQDPNAPPWVREALGWLEGSTRPVAALMDPAVLRSVLDTLARRLDGQPAAATTISRKRAVLHNAIAYAIERELLPANPIEAVKWKPPKSATTIDRRVVVNPVQARSLLLALRGLPSGERHVAFFAVMYFAALRPEEAVNLGQRNLSLPRQGWGGLVLDEATPETGRRWTDSGRSRDVRQLKHRARGESREIPCSPEMVVLLRAHLDQFGVDEEGRLFRGVRGGEVSASTYGRLWDQVRRAAFTPEVYASLLARRPYDLRHAAVSTWLNAGVPPTQVAEWAGHSVDVLLRVYAKCLDGQQAAARARVEAALRGRV